MLDFLIDSYKNVPLWKIVAEVIVFFFGIISVFFAKKEHILVYPTGLICTLITVYLLYIANYYGEVILNSYYSIMSFYGWYKWSKKSDKPDLKISRTSPKEKKIGLLIFSITALLTYFVYVFFDYELEIPNYIDIFTSGLFFTAMWYMALKKIENWTLYIIGDVIAVPLFIYRGYNLLALQYVIFTILAILAYLEWKKYLAKQI